MKYFLGSEQNAARVCLLLGQVVVALAIAYLVYRMILEPLLLALARALVG